MRSDFKEQKSVVFRQPSRQSTSWHESWRYTLLKWIGRNEKDTVVMERIESYLSVLLGRLECFIASRIHAEERRSAHCWNWDFAIVL